LPFRQPSTDRSVQRQYWWRAAAVDDGDVQIQKCCIHIIPQILTTDPLTGCIRNWGRNRAVKTNQLVY